MIKKKPKRTSGSAKIKKRMRNRANASSFSSRYSRRGPENRRVIYWYILIIFQIIVLCYLVIRDKDKIFPPSEEEVVATTSTEQGTETISSSTKSDPVYEEYELHEDYIAPPTNSSNYTASGKVSAAEVPSGKAPVLSKSSLPLKQNPPSDNLGKTSARASNSPKSSSSGLAPVSPASNLAKIKQHTSPNTWEKNAVKTIELPSGYPIIAIIIDDMGIDKVHTKAILDIPAPLTVSFITYASDLRYWGDYARSTGKEIMLHIPMQPSNASVDSGPNTLTTSMKRQDIQRVLQDTVFPLLSTLKPAGANNHMGSKFTADKVLMSYFMETFSSYGLYFIDSLTSKDSSGLLAADTYGIPAASRNVFLDNTDDFSYVMNQLSLLEKAARKHGFAIGIGHPHVSTIQALNVWVNTLGDKGLYLVPTSAIIRARLKQTGA